jgi:hypothetical protein
VPLPVGMLEEIAGGRLMAAWWGWYRCIQLTHSLKAPGFNP